MAARETVLVTGGIGYIGSFTTLELLQDGYQVVVVDNCYNGSPEALHRIELICGRKALFEKVDLRDFDALHGVFIKYPKISSVIHFAALKAVGESAEKPLDYYDTNIGGTINLLKAMEKNKVKNIVFSSSATVYGDASTHKDMIPIPEHCPLSATNVYAETKIAIENLLRAQCKAHPDYSAALLRYFNPAGAHPSGILGEDPHGVPYNLFPLLSQVATGKREKLYVFGTDYKSKDGTAIRDYIHIVDLAKGHLAALNYLREHDVGCRAWNLGTGTGYTVYEIIHAFEKAIEHSVPYEVKGRRAGDVLNLTAIVDRANSELKWKADQTLETTCADLWRWVVNNPDGYRQNPPQHLLDALRK